MYVLLSASGHTTIIVYKLNSQSNWISTKYSMPVSSKRNINQIANQPIYFINYHRFDHNPETSLDTSKWQINQIFAQTEVCSFALAFRWVRRNNCAQILDDLMLIFVSLVYRYSPCCMNFSHSTFRMPRNSLNNRFSCGCHCTTYVLCMYVASKANESIMSSFYRIDVLQKRFLAIKWKRR